MAEFEEETYSTIFAALKHPTRRKILRLLSEKPRSFTEIQNLFKVDSPYLTYHLDALKELVSKTEDGRYRLSTMGEGAMALMRGVEEAPKKPAFALPLKWKSCIIVLALSTIILGGACFALYYEYHDDVAFWLKFAEAKGRLTAESIGPPWFRENYRLTTIDEVIQVFGEDLLLPKWMPEGINLKKIYIFEGEATTAFLIYSDKDIEDYGEGNISIKMTKPSASPTLESLMKHAENVDNLLIKIDDKWAEVSGMTPGYTVTIELSSGKVIKGWVDKPRPAHLYFWHKDIYYEISGYTWQNNLIKIAENMKEY